MPIRCYWRGKPAVASLAIRTVPDPSTNLLLLQSGELDWNLLAPAQVAVVRGNSQLRFVKVPTAVVAGLAFNTARAPLDDTRLRRALAMSIDRNAISRKITLGIYPVTEHAAAAVFVGVRSVGAGTGLRSARRRCGLRCGRLAARTPTACAAATAWRCDWSTCSSPKRPRACASRPTVQAELRDRGVDVVDQSGEQRATLSAAHGRTRDRQLRHGVRSLDDGRGPRRFRRVALRRAVELYALVQCARSTRWNLTALAQTDRAARKTHLSQHRADRGARRSRALSIQRRLRLCVPPAA